jgi:hypothetical protein
MARFIINPPITDDRDYYRFDEDMVQRVLAGDSVLAIGLRRSGKTSFLYRVRRAAEKVPRDVLFYDLRDFFLDEKPDAATAAAVAEVASHPGAIVLIDEADAFSPEHGPILEDLLKACRGRPAVLGLAPAFLETHQQSSGVQGLIDPWLIHFLGPLSKKEAFDLLGQTGRSKSPTLSPEIMEEIWRGGDRLPIVLRALGAKHAEGLELGISLAGLGPRILSGLGPAAKGVLTRVVRGEPVDSGSEDVERLILLGALIKKKPRNGAVVEVAGAVLRKFLEWAVPKPAPATPSPAGDPEPAGTWQRHARILHLSDLHFGPHCIEQKRSAEEQLERLTAVLEHDQVLPDFIAVTGDLSWSGKQAEMHLAEQFLEGLAGWLRKQRKCSDQQARAQFLIIPGNHDAAWALSDGLSALTAEEQEEWLWYSLAPFANFVNRFHRGKVLWDLERPYHHRVFPKPSVAFLAISTSHLITRSSKEGKFGRHVLDQVPRLFEQPSVKNAQFRVGLIHHNIRAFHQDGRLIADIEEALVRFAKCQPPCDFFLHGHVHQGEVDDYKPRGNRPEVPYSAVGSFGVRAEHRPGDVHHGQVPNEFAIVDLETSGTGRRYVTQFYQLAFTPTGSWEWQTGKQRIRPL